MLRLEVVDLRKCVDESRPVGTAARVYRDKSEFVELMASALLGNPGVWRWKGKFSVAGMRQDIHSFLIEVLRTLLKLFSA